MTTEAQANASRLNGARSRGPITSEGRAVACLNAMKHGIYSELTLIDGESEVELLAFGGRLREQLAPDGELELMLADKIVSIAWRLRRITGVEAAMYDNSESNRLVFDRYRAEGIVRLGRHEAHLERCLYRALHELERRQAARKGQSVPAPAAVDVVVSWEGGEPRELESAAVLCLHQAGGE